MAERKEKKKKYITEQERYKIEKKLSQKKTMKQISEELDINYHTLRKEIIRGMVTQVTTDLIKVEVYKADVAQRIYDTNTARRGRKNKIAKGGKFALFAEHMIKNERYSPYALLREAVNQGLLADDVCVKTVYNAIDAGIVDVSRKNMPYKKEDGRKSNGKRRKVSLRNTDCNLIDSRPKHIEDRQEYGHWEMDTVYSAKETGKACLLVLTERMTRIDIVIKIKSRTQFDVCKALDKLEKRLGKKKFNEKFKTITCDNGGEFLNYRRMCKSVFGGFRTVVYFCHPYASWERGSNENLNVLIRRWFPKGTDFDKVTSKQVAEVEYWINNYPRKLFDGLSSNEYKEKLAIAI